MVEKVLNIKIKTEIIEVKKNIKIDQGLDHIQDTVDQEAKSNFKNNQYIYISYYSRRKSSSKSYDKSKNRQTTKKINKTSNIREVTNDYIETKY